MNKTCIKTSLFLLFLACLPAGTLFSQNVGINTIAAKPDPSALLDVSDSGSAIHRGFLPPRMTGAQMASITNPAAGLIVFNSSTNCMEYFNGTAWQNMVCPCTGPPATPGIITGGATLCVSSAGNVYSIAAVSGAMSYTWSVPAGAFITAGAGTTSITVTFATASGNISVTAANSCGTSAASVLAITLNSISSAPAVPSGSTSPSTSSAYTYTIAAVTGAASYTWSVSNTNGSVTAGQGTTSATITFGGTSAVMNICVYDSNACGISASSCLPVTSNSCASGSQTFSYTGSLLTFTVPGCVSSITVTAYGAQGGGGDGGLGGEAIATIPVTGGSTLDVYVGGNPTTQIGPGGYNGGGASTVDPCGGPPDDGFPGGGASDVRIAPYSLTDRVIVAGGGGGQGWNPGMGGSGGGLTGGDGQNSWVSNSQGLGATQSAGGAGGYYTGDPPATSGSLGQGGAADTYTGLCSGGGGGGGYYGGGGGFVAPGGGGSSYVAYPGNTNTSTVSGVNTGNGSVIIAW